MAVDPGSDGCTWFGHVAVGAIAQAIGRERGWLLMWLGDVAMIWEPSDQRILQWSMIETRVIDPVFGGQHGCTAHLVFEEKKILPLIHNTLC
jgi:hypothetical protein